jgi:hypothetical protein
MKQLLKIFVPVWAILLWTLYYQMCMKGSLANVPIVILSLVLFVIVTSSFAVLGDRVSDHNRLWHCTKCGDYYRGYQSGCSGKCYRGKHRIVTDEYKWMKGHPDFPRHGIIAMIKFWRLGRLIEKQKRERESFREWKRLWESRNGEKMEVPDDLAAMFEDEDERVYARSSANRRIDMKIQNILEEMSSDINKELDSERKDD